MSNDSGSVSEPTPESDSEAGGWIQIKDIEVYLLEAGSEFEEITGIVEKHIASIEWIANALC